MRVLPTRIHGVIDYAWGASMLALPAVSGLPYGSAGWIVALVFGLGAIGYSLVTAYELGFVRLIPMPAHLGLDALAGGVLAILPALLGMQGPIAWAFVGFGLFSLLAAFVTKAEPDRVAMVG